MTPHIEKEDNKFVVSLKESDKVELLVNGEKVIGFSTPFTKGELACYLKQERKPILW